MVNLENNQYARYRKDNGKDGEYVCDFRINLNGCPEGSSYKTALKCLVPFTLFIVTISLSFLYYRVKVKGQSVFFPATRERGMIRPRPQDSFHIAVVIYNFSQSIVLIFLITDSFPSVTIAEISANIPKLLGFACAVLYPISIIYSTPILKHATYSLQWNPNKLSIDGLAIYLMLGPLLTTVPLTALTGYFAEKKDFSKAYMIFMVQAFVWSTWTIQYVITLLYVYYKLICMLKGYINILQRRRGDPDADMKIKKLKSASHNLTWIVFAVFLVFLLNFMEGIIVGLTYKYNMDIHAYYFISWNFATPFLTFIGQMIFLYDTLKNRKSPQHQRNKNTYDRINNIPSRLEQKPAPILQEDTDLSSVPMTEGVVNSKSAQKSKASIFLLTSNNDKPNSNNAISTNGTSVSNIIPMESNSHLQDLEEIIEEDKSIKSVVITTSPVRKSWLFRKPTRADDLTK